MIIKELHTKRLILRQWIESDFLPFAQLNSDPEVMKYFPEILNRDQSGKMAKKIQAMITDNGWGFWATEEKETGSFIGFIGLHNPDYELPFSPCTEIGWRLSKSFWGKGYATEGAKEALKYAFTELSISKVVSFTPVNNIKSSSVMKRIGMKNTFQNFPHPKVSADSELSEHVLYEITKDEWYSNAG